MSIEKMDYNESKKSMSQQLLFSVSLFMFLFGSANQYLDSDYNKYQMMKTALLYLKFPDSNLHFFRVFVLLRQFLHGRRCSRYFQ